MSVAEEQAYSRLCINAPAAAIADRVICALFPFDLAGIEEGEESWIIYRQTPADAWEDILSCLRQFAPQAQPLAPAQPVIWENWLEKWKEYFQPQRIGVFSVQAPWSDVPAAAVPIIIEPQMAFGTGTHATTQLLLEFISEDSVDKSTCIDLGCGSGVLTFAAAAMGYEVLLALDHDPEAIANARHNASLNAFAVDVFRLGDLADSFLPTAILVLANLNDALLTEHARRLAATVRQGGRLLLSGLLTSQEAVVTHAFAEAGMMVIESRQRDEWSALAMRQR
jgi:ribosomal protein L11 methyltransferase